jgi:hypothetical protein
LLSKHSNKHYTNAQNNIDDDDDYDDDDDDNSNNNDNNDYNYNKLNSKNYKGNESVFTHSWICPLYSGVLSPKTKFLYISL